MLPVGGGGGAASPMPASSTSSSLSPLAPPFTVGSQPPSRRFDFNPDLPAIPTPQASPHYLAPSAGPDWSNPSSAAAAAHRLPSRFDPSPYYPRFPPAAADGSFEALAGIGEYTGASGGDWSGQFDGQAAQGVGDVGSSWMDSSLDYQAFPFQEGGTSEGLISYPNVSGVWHGKHGNSFRRKVGFGSEWMYDRHPATVEDNTVLPCEISGTSVLVPGLTKELPYSQNPTSLSLMESKSIFNLNYYDTYMTCPVNTCSTSIQVHDQASQITSSSVDCGTPKHVYSVVQHVDSYNTYGDCYSHISSNTGECNANQNVADTVFDMTIREDNIRESTHMPVDSFSVKSGLPSGNELVSPVETSEEANFGLELKHLNLPSTFNYGNGSGTKVSKRSPSLTLDELNFAVDSPCWKGTRASQQFHHDVADTIELPQVVESKACGNFDMGQRHCTEGVVYSETSLSFEQVGGLVSSENKEPSSVSYLGEPSSVILSGILQNHDDANKTELNCLKDDKGKGLRCSTICIEQSNEAKTELHCLKDDNGKGLHCSTVCIDQSNEDRKNKNMDSEVNGIEVSRFGKEQHAVSSDQVTTRNEIASSEKYLEPAVQHTANCNPHGRPLLEGNCTHLLVKSMHALSEMLLSSYNSPTDELNGQNLELLQSVIHNIEAFTTTNKEATQSQNTGVKLDSFTNHIKNRSDHEMKGKLHSIGSSNSTELNKINSMSQTFGKVVDRPSFELEENQHALIYKNLWIEAEATLCSMKYELQVARLQVEMEDKKNKTKDFLGRCPAASLSTLKATQDFEVHHTSMKSKEDLSSSVMPSSDDASYGKPLETPSNANVTEGIDASVLARHIFLQERLKRTGIEQQICGAINTGGHVGAGAVHIPSPEVGSNAALDHLPAKLADLGFIESNNSQPANDFHWDKEKPKLPDRSYDRLFASITAGDSANAEVRGRPSGVGLTTRGMSVASGRANVTHEWGHVIKEDLKC